jgi:hypothetical protein
MDEAGGCTSICYDLEFFVSWFTGCLVESWELGRRRSNGAETDTKFQVCLVVLVKFLDNSFVCIC